MANFLGANAGLPNNGIIGTATNDNATAGNVGQTITSAVGSTNFPTTAQWGDLTSISLTAGDWLVSCNTSSILQVNTTIVQAGISTTTGNSGTGLTIGDTFLAFNNPGVGAIANFPISIVSVRASLSGTTIYYLKYQATYTGTTPSMSGRITAVRIR